MTMTNLNELKVTNTEYSLESGFFWVEFENGKTLQLCLVETEQTEEEHFKNGSIYQPKISASDNGFNWGVCADCNSWAVDDDEWGHIEEFLLEKAREAGLEIVP